MRVLHYVHSLGGYSGATKQALLLAKELEILGCNQKFVSEKTGTVNSDDNKYGKGALYLSNGFFGFVEFIKLLINFRPNVVHFHGASFKYLPLSAAFSKVYWKTTLYGDDDFSALLNNTTKFKAFLKRNLIRLIGMNNTLTKQNYSENIKYLDSDKLTIIPNGVAISESEYFGKDNIIVIVAAVIPRKRVYLGIKFFKANFERLGFRLYIVGPYDDELLDGYSKSYVDQCLSFSSESIVFTNKVSSNDVQLLLDRTKYMILFSEKEGMPNVVLEGLSKGVYPFLTEIGGVANEVLKSSSNGMILKDENIELPIKLPEYDFELYSKCRLFVSQHYSMKVVASNTLSKYKMLIEKG